MNKAGGLKFSVKIKHNKHKMLRKHVFSQKPSSSMGSTRPDSYMVPVVYRL